MAFMKTSVIGVSRTLSGPYFSRRPLDIYKNRQLNKYQKLLYINKNNEQITIKNNEQVKNGENGETLKRQRDAKPCRHPGTLQPKKV